MNEITQCLERMAQDGPAAANDLVALVYSELRRMAAIKLARERFPQTLQATCLVHEAWLRLGDLRFNNRPHFFSAAAEAMRRILVDRARRKLAAKHGGNADHLDIEEVEIPVPMGADEEITAVHEALDQLARHDAKKAELVKLRYFAGLSFEEVADVLEISVTTAKRDWAYARAWLHRRILSNANR